VHTGFCWGNLKEKRQLERPRRRKKDNIRMDLQEMGCGRGARTGSIWLSTRGRWRALANAVILRGP